MKMLPLLQTLSHQTLLFLRQTVVRSAWVLLLLLTGPAAMAQLSGAYTINSAQPTGGTNYASFAAAVGALGAGVSAPVTFTVSGGPYTEQLSLGPITGASVTNRVTFNGGGRTIQFGSNDAAQRAVITLNGADYVTLNDLTVDATEGGTSTAAYGWGILLVNNADHNIIRNCTVVSGTSTSNSNFAGIVSSAVATAATTTGTTASQDLTIEGNTVTGGYYSIAAVGSGVATALTPGVVIRNNTLRDFYFYGIFASYLGSPQLIGNDISRPTRTTVGVFYGISLGAGISGAAVEKNRIHRAFLPTATGTSGVFALYLTTGTAATATAPNVVANNVLYGLGGNGNVYGFYNASSSYFYYYHNTLNLDDPASAGSGNTYGLYQTSGLGVEFKNNIVRINRPGPSYAVYVSSAAGSTVSDYNDLVGTGTTFQTGYYNGQGYPTLADWQAVNSRAFDQRSLALSPQFVGAITGNLQPLDGALDGAATLLARVTDDITGAPRSPTAPDLGAYEFVPAAYDVAVVSIDSPTPTVLPGTHPVAVTIRNNGGALLTSVTLSYVLNGGTPVTQLFSFTPGLAAGATQQLRFTTGVASIYGPNTLTVTSILPNGQPDNNTANDVQTLAFTQPAPANDEPCGALPLGAAPVAGSNTGASASGQPGIGLSLPACGSAQAPKDVWFTVAAPSGGTALRLALTGPAAGMVRVFTSPDCSAGTFALVFCQSGGAPNTSAGTFTVPSLTGGQTYYVAVSGYGSGDATGDFTIAATTVLGTRPSTSGEALTVFPNPSATGQLLIRLTQSSGSGSVELLNALGQVVRQQALENRSEQQLATNGLGAGLYTLRVQAGGQAHTRKVVLQ